MINRKVIYRAKTSTEKKLAKQERATRCNYWPKRAVVIIDDSMVSGLKERLQSNKKTRNQGKILQKRNGRRYI